MCPRYLLIDPLGQQALEFTCVSVREQSTLTFCAKSIHVVEIISFVILFYIMKCILEKSDQTC